MSQFSVAAQSNSAAAVQQNQQAQPAFDSVPNTSQNRRQIYFFDDKPQVNNLWFTSIDQIKTVLDVNILPEDFFRKQKNFFRWDDPFKLSRKNDVLLFSVCFFIEPNLRFSYKC